MKSSVVEQIKSRLPITDILSTYLTLIPAGTQFKAKCPFHNERTASFSISPERGVYYCFGCGAKGDIFEFVQQFEGLDFKGALTLLADRAGVTLDNTVVPTTDTDPLYSALEAATLRYQTILAKHPEVLEYLHARGLTDETIASFRIGYAPSEWRFLAESISEKDRASYERAGLIKSTEKGYYDRFRGRIMFPMNDSSGRVVAFSGRIFPETPDDPKYLNSPETEVFHKSRILYGFDKAKTAIKKHNFAILVEGQMDMVMSHQAGFRNTVATSGTAVSETAIGDAQAQLQVLSRLTPNIFLAFDGDSAGQKAAGRAALVALALGLNPKVVPLPEGVDPADYLKEGNSEAWKDLLKQSEHFILHELRAVRSVATSAHSFVGLMKERLLPFLARVASPIEKTLYIDTIAKELGIKSSDVEHELSLFKQAQESVAKVSVVAAQESITPHKQSITLAERLVALEHRYPSPAITAQVAELRALSFEEDQIVLIDAAMLDPSIIAIVEREYGALDQALRDTVASELAKVLSDQFFDTVRARLSTELAVAERQGDDTRAAALLTTLQTLTLRRHST